MCWVGKCDAKIAKKDIIVYKIGSVSEEGFRSFYQNYIYVPKGTNNKINIKPFIHDCNTYKPKKEQYCLIYEGYHSYKEITMPYSELDMCTKLIYLGRIIDRISLFNPYYIATFIIPKGSEYYENEDEELVSSNIIYTGKYIKL